MRVPGSHNSKNDEWREVANVVTRKGGYTLIQLEKWLTKATPVWSSERNTELALAEKAFFDPA
jgi:hypothetical protein